MSTHRLDHELTVHNELARQRGESKYVVTVCLLHYRLKRARGTVVNRWDATDCKNCLRIGGFTSMAPIQLGFSNPESKGQNFDPVPAGDYPCTFFEITQEVGKESKAPYLKFVFKPTDPEMESRRFFKNYSLQAKALWAIKEDILIPFGLATAEELEGQDFAFEPRDILGKPCVLEIAESTYQGKPTNDVTGVRPSGGAGSSWD